MAMWVSVMCIGSEFHYTVLFAWVSTPMFKMKWTGRKGINNSQSFWCSRPEWRWWFRKVRNGCQTSTREAWALLMFWLHCMEWVLANHFESTQEPGRFQGFIRTNGIALVYLNGSQVHSCDVNFLCVSSSNEYSGEDTEVSKLEHFQYAPLVEWTRTCRPTLSSRDLKDLWGVFLCGFFNVTGEVKTNDQEFQNK